MPRRSTSKPGEDETELDIKPEESPEPKPKPEEKVPEPPKEPEVKKEDKPKQKRTFTAAEKTSTICVLCGDKKATGMDGKPKCPSNNSECPYLS